MPEVSVSDPSASRSTIVLSRYCAPIRRLFAGCPPTFDPQRKRSVPSICGCSPLGCRLELRIPDKPNAKIQIGSQPTSRSTLSTRQSSPLGEVSSPVLGHRPGRLAPSGQQALGSTASWSRSEIRSVFNKRSEPRSPGEQSRLPDASATPIDGNGFRAEIGGREMGA